MASFESLVAEANLELGLARGIQLEISVLVGLHRRGHARRHVTLLVSALHALDRERCLACVDTAFVRRRFHGREHRLDLQQGQGPGLHRARTGRVDVARNGRARVRQRSRSIKCGSSHLVVVGARQLDRSTIVGLSYPVAALTDMVLGAASMYSPVSSGVKVSTPG